MSLIASAISFINRDFSWQTPRTGKGVITYHRKILGVRHPECSVRKRTYHEHSQSEIIRASKTRPASQRYAPLCGVSMPCEEQDRLLRELKSAVDEHAQLVEEIVTLIRSGQTREGFHVLVRKAAESKAKWEMTRNELSAHRER